MTIFVGIIAFFIAWTIIGILLSSDVDRRKIKTKRKMIMFIILQGPLIGLMHSIMVIGDVTKNYFEKND